ncbi:MAG: adenylate/guanylate cyclase domain-containing protein, partial [Pseudomonadota bacterium]
DTGAASGVFRVATDRSGLVVGYQEGVAAFPDLGSFPGAVLAAIGRPSTPAGPPSRLRPFWLYGPAGSLPTTGLAEVLGAAAAAGRDLEGIAVFVGISDPTRPGEKDHFRTPVSGGAADTIAGVELGATLVLNRLHGQEARRLGLMLAPDAPALVEAAVAGVLGFIGALAMAGYGGWRGAGRVVALAAAVALASVFLFTEARLWWPVAVPVALGLPATAVLLLVTGYGRTRTFLRQRLPRPVAEALLDDGGVTDALAPRPLRAAVLYADLAGSVPLADALGPGAYAERLTGLQARFSAAVEAEGGIVVEVEGDALLAVFPVEGWSVGGAASMGVADDAAAAAGAVLAAAAGLEAARTATPPLMLRIGLTLGDVVMGETEAGGRLALRVFGTPVGLAERLQRAADSFRPEGGSVALADDALVAAASRVWQKGILLPVGRLKLRGLATPQGAHKLTSDNIPADLRH